VLCHGIFKPKRTQVSINVLAILLLIPLLSCATRKSLIIELIYAFAQRSERAFMISPEK